MNEPTPGEERRRPDAPEPEGERRPDAPEADAPGAGWRRLDPRTLLATAALLCGVAGGAGLPVALGLAGSRPLWQAVAWVLAGALLLVLGGTGADRIRLLRTRYRVGPERVDLHTGLLHLKRRSLARERIRSVDLTANPSSASSAWSRSASEPASTAAATRPSRSNWSPAPRANGSGANSRPRRRARGPPPRRRPRRPRPPLDPLRPRLLRRPALGGAAAGAVMQVSEWFGAQGEVIDWIGERFSSVAIPWTILWLLLVALAVGAVGALGLWVEMWWNYRLEREPGGTLRVTRGLLTARSVSIEERRLRGIELVEPLGVRLFGAARVDAVATGLAEKDEDKHGDLKNLTPAVPARWPTGSPPGSCASPDRPPGRRSPPTPGPPGTGGSAGPCGAS